MAWASGQIAPHRCVRESSPRQFLTHSFSACALLCCRGGHSTAGPPGSPVECHCRRRHGGGSGYDGGRRRGCPSGPARRFAASRHLHQPSCSTARSTADLSGLQGSRAPASCPESGAAEQACSPCTQNSSAAGAAPASGAVQHRRSECGKGLRGNCRPCSEHVCCDDGTALIVVRCLARHTFNDL